MAGAVLILAGERGWLERGRLVFSHIYPINTIICHDVEAYRTFSFVREKSSYLGEVGHRGGLLRFLHRPFSQTFLYISPTKLQQACCSSEWKSLLGKLHAAVTESCRTQVRVWFCCLFSFDYNYRIICF